MKPTLIVTVDTEEEGLWGGQYRRTGNSVENIRGIPRFQALCDDYSVRPTYLIDTPVVESREAVKTLREIFDGGRCEIGGHLHPWCSPPFDEELSDRNTFHCNLPADLQREKLTRLTETIEREFGHRPTSFRAGRYGLDIIGARILRDLGYKVDSSVIPFTDYSAEGGPDFNDAPFQPYFIDGDELTIPHQSGYLVEVPVSVGFNRTAFRTAHRIQQFAARGPFRALRPVGIMDRLGLIQRIKLSPEQATAPQMCKLIDTSIAAGANCLVMMFHSSSLMPGGSPYVPDEAALELFMDRIGDVFNAYLRQQRLKSRTLTEFAESCVERSLKTMQAGCDIQR